MEFRDVTQDLKSDLTKVEEAINQNYKSDLPLIPGISSYLMSCGGKRIRPMLVLLGAKLCGRETDDAVVKHGCAVEYLHAASLLHDDVVDDATIRRGKPSINQVWKNKISVLMGDFILSKALINMIGIKDFDALEQISNTAEKLSAGEILQIEKNITKSMTEDVYFDIINQKTASLIATSCELGAITTSKTDQDRKATFNFGQNLGMAFQIKDDLFDLLGKESDTGKNSGGDVKRNLMTLPLIFSYSHMTKSENRQLKKLMGTKKKTRRILTDIRGMIDDSGGFEYARKKLDDFSNNALDAISFYPDSPVKQSLSDLVAFNALRVK